MKKFRCITGQFHCDRVAQPTVRTVLWSFWIPHSTGFQSSATGHRFSLPPVSLGIAGQRAVGTWSDGSRDSYLSVLIREKVVVVQGGYPTIVSRSRSEKKRYSIIPCIPYVTGPRHGKYYSPASQYITILFPDLVSADLVDSYTARLCLQHNSSRFVCQQDE